MKKKDTDKIKQEFRMRQNRQIAAITVAMFIVLLSAVIHMRPGLVGAVSRQTLFGLQVISIVAFIGFSAYNWRCPNCGKYLGGDLYRQHCRKCGTRLQ